MNAPLGLGVGAHDAAAAVEPEGCSGGGAAVGLGVARGVCGGRGRCVMHGQQRCHQHPVHWQLAAADVTRLYGAIWHGSRSCPSKKQGILAIVQTNTYTHCMQSFFCYGWANSRRSAVCCTHRDVLLIRNSDSGCAEVGGVAGEGEAVSANREVIGACTA